MTGVLEFKSRTVISAEWNQVTLGDIISLEYGRSLPEKSRRPGNVPVYGSNGIVGWHDEALVPSGGIIIGRKGTAGSVTVSPDPFWPIDTTYFVKERLPVDWGWLAATLHHARLNELNEATGVPGLNRDKAYRQPILLPPLDEQRRIAEVLRSVDEAIATSQQVAEQMQTVWDGLTETLIWDRLLNSPDVAQPLGRALEGSDYGVNVPLGNEPTGYAVLRMGNLQDGRIDPTDLKWGEISEREAETLALDVGDILFNRTNSRDLVGKVALVREPTDFLYASYIVRLRVNRSVADPYYLFAVMHSRRAQAQFKSIATPGVSQSNINPTNLKKQVIPFPPLAEQRDIAAQLQSAEAAHRTVQEELVTLRQIKSDLMSDLLSGHVRV